MIRTVDAIKTLHKDIKSTVEIFSASIYNRKVVKFSICLLQSICMAKSKNPIVFGEVWTR